MTLILIKIALRAVVFSVAAPVWVGCVVLGAFSSLSRNYRKAPQSQ